MSSSDNNHDNASSWNESRRLIVSQIRNTDSSIKELTSKIDLLNEKNRDRIGVLEALVAVQLSDMRVRIAMLEVRAKIWGGMIGAVGGIIASIAALLLEKGLK